MIILGLIVEINGYKAVGKSTLIAGLRKRFPNALFREGFRKIKNGLDQAKEEEYYENERAYIKREIEEFKELINSDKLVILLRGPEDCLFYAKYAPKLKFGYDWDVETRLKEEFEELKKYKADYILWLDADKDVINNRKINDSTKPRLNMEKWNKIWNPFLGDYIKQIPYTEILDTSNMDKKDVLEWTVDYINKKMRNRKMMPERLYIETTNLCNARCIMCPHPKMKRKALTMSDTTFNIIAENLKNTDLSKTSVFMHKEGEPLMDPSIFERIIKIKSETNCKEVIINTNASLLTKEKSCKLIDSGTDVVYISLDGCTKENYEAVRIGLNYDMVMENVLQLFEVINEKKSDIKVILQMLVYSKNESETEEYINFWSKYPCEIFIKKMHSYLDGCESESCGQLSFDQLHACTDPFNMIVIYSDGSVGLCCWDYENTLNIGNIHDSYVCDLFNGERAVMIREMHSKFGCKELEPCNRCMRAFGDDSICGESGGKTIKIQ